MKKKTFEEGLEQLDTLVKSMESGELSLESSVNAFEKSMTLLSALQDQLDKTEKKVMKLSSAGQEKPGTDPETTKEEL